MQPAVITGAIFPEQHYRQRSDPGHDGESARESLLRQMVSPVRWIETVRNQYANGARFWLELGPKAVLGKMVAPCLNGIAVGSDALRVELVSTLESLTAFSL